MPDRDRLKRAYDRLAALPFPDHPEADELDELMLDLTELDGYLAGIAQDVLDGGAVPARIADLTALERRFRDVEVNGDDAEILAQCQEYFAAMREVVTALQA